MTEKNRARFRTCCLTVTFCFLLLPISVQAQESSPRSAKAPLQGGVEHDESLPALSGQFKVGSQMDDAQLTALSPDNVWFPIPVWLAGKWHAESKTIDYVQDCTSGASASPHTVVKEVSQAVHGHQRDRTGQIWEFIEIPSIRKVGLRQGTAYLRTLREDVLNSTPSAVVLKVLTNQITVNNKNDIVDSNQVQQIGTYSPLEDGVVQLSASLKNFDGDGAPIQMQRSSMIMKRAENYEEIDNLNGHDLKRLFAEFLKKQGRQDLIPAP